MQKKIYIIWIWGIWVSAIARYYNENWYKVYWSDSTNSELIETLRKEWIDIVIWVDENKVDNNINLVVYTEAIPESHIELKKAKKLLIKTLTYPEALGVIANDKKLIAVTWTHGKSTTSSMWAIMLQKSKLWVNAVVWTLLNEFNWKNTFFSDSDYFIIEACEYKRSFLNYTPYIWIITNIEIDHLDYYKNLEDYISAYKDFVNNIKSWWYLIINWEDKNCQTLIWIRNDIKYIEVHNWYFLYNWHIYIYLEYNLQIPGQHILFDSRLIYCLWIILWLDNNLIINYLESYSWVWRRMENIGHTINWNLVISDYWHHPTEIKLTLGAIKNKYIDKKILVVFQPHQYNRTIELLDWFKNSFLNADLLIIPNIYESRDSEEDKKNMSPQKLLDNIVLENKINGQWLKNTIKIIQDYEEKNQNNSVIILMWAWDIDILRYELF